MFFHYLIKSVGAILIKHGMKLHRHLVLDLIMADFYLTYNSYVYAVQD